MQLAKTVPFAAKQTRTEFSVLLDRVRDLKPIFRESARDTETNRRVSKKTMDLLRDAELTKLVRPARFGGFEYGLTELAQIAFELGSVCGSTGWCGSLAMCYQWMTSYFPLEAQRDVWSDPDNLVAGSYNPSKDCEIVPGGIKLAGTWPYASNCENSQWVMLGALIQNSKGPPDVMWCLVPITDMVVDQDTWFTSGLQGTGSKTVSIDKPVFVPDHRMVRFADIVAGTVPGKDIENNNMSHFGFTTFGPTALVTPVLGMAQGALEAFIHLAQTKVRAAKPGMIVPMANSPMVQNKIGAASATIESALTLLLTSVTAAEDKVRRGIPLEVGERIAIRRNQGFAAKQSVAVVNDLFAKEGAAGSDLAAPLQRFWRDVNAAALHLSLDWEAIAAMYGQQKLGLDPVGPLLRSDEMTDTQRHPAGSTSGVVVKGCQNHQLIADAKLALRRLASSVSVVTCRHDGRNFAMTATAVSALSMDPPAMLVCVNRSAVFYRALNRTNEFPINVLSRAHIDISQLCSGGASPDSRFEVGDWDTRALAPVLTDAQAAIICRKDRELDYGTHTVFMGRIVSVSMNGEVDPLIYLDGQYTGRAA